MSTVCIVAAAGGPAAQAQESVAACADCHRTEAAEIAGSSHASLSCTECHGGSEKYPVSSSEIGRFAASLSAGGSTASFEHGEGFTGKPSRADVPERCGACHADVKRMNPYGIPTDQLTRYWTSGHGTALRENGDDRVAVCTDCHGVHDVLPAAEPASLTHPLNVPGMCATCHADAGLMADYDLSTEVVDEYRRSVHGELLFEQHDTGAPTCATCHGNHSAMPPGFASVGAVCGKCHQHASANFATSIHAGVEGHMGCVQCHGGGEDRHFHLIERITKPAGVMIQRYAHLLASEPNPTAEQISAAIHPDPQQIVQRALPTCMDCHDDIEDDESLPVLFELMDKIGEAERSFVQTGRRLDEIGRGVLLVDRQRFEFEEAKTHLIELAPLQHTLDNEKVAAKVAELNAVCERVNTELDELEAGLRFRRSALLPIWAFMLVFAVLLYAKFRQLKAKYVVS